MLSNWSIGSGGRPTLRPVRGKFMMAEDPVAVNGSAGRVVARKIRSITPAARSRLYGPIPDFRKRAQSVDPHALDPIIDGVRSVVVEKPGYTAGRRRSGRRPHASGGRRLARVRGRLSRMPDATALSGKPEKRDERGPLRAGRAVPEAVEAREGTDRWDSARCR
jgi:hypothetical protein